MGEGGCIVDKHHVDAARDHLRDGFWVALERHPQQLPTNRARQGLTHHCAAGIAGGQSKLSRLTKSDQLPHACDRQTRVHDQDAGKHGDPIHSHEVSERVVADPLLQARIRTVGRVCTHQERVAVGFGLRHGDSGDRTIGARFVVDDDLLTKQLVQPLSEQPGDCVSPAARPERQDDGDRPGRILWPLSQDHRGQGNQATGKDG